MVNSANLSARNCFNLPRAALCLGLSVALMWPTLVAAQSEVIGGISTQSTPRLMPASIGDLNGDGLDDMVFGAPGSSPDGAESAGSVFVRFGRNDDPTQHIDLTTRTAYDLRVDGIKAYDQLGFVTAVADFNGDDLGDLIVSAPGNKGAVYLFFGQKNWAEAVLRADRADVSFVGDEEGAYVGASLCVGDLNRDRHADLVISALGFNDLAVVDSTNVHVIPGKSNWNSVYPLGERIPGRVLASRALFGDVSVVHTCAIGDLDDDGVGDLALGMPLEGHEGYEELGTVSIVYDVLATNGGTFDLGDLDGEWGIRLFGSQPGARFGSALAIADLNADLHQDLIVGAPHRVVKGPDDGGAVYLFLGGMLPQESSFQEEDLVLYGSGEGFGRVIDVLDFNRDERPDLLLGAPQATGAAGKGAGQLDILLGGPQLADLKPRDWSSIKLSGAAPGEGFGDGAALGDVDGDGLVELLVRSTGFAPDRPETGAFYAFDVEALDSDVLRDEAQLEIFGPGWGGLLSPQLVYADIDNDAHAESIWLSPRGSGNRGVICIAKADSSVVNLASGEGCYSRILGPEGATITSIDLAQADNKKGIELLMGLPNLHHRDGVGAVIMFTVQGEGEVQIDLDTPGIWAWLADDQSQSLGSQVAFGHFDNQERVIASAASATYEDRRQAGTILVMAPIGKAEILHVDDEEVVDLRFQGEAQGHLGRFALTDLNANHKADLLLLAPYESRMELAGAGAMHLLFDIQELSPGVHEVADSDVFTTRYIGPSPNSALEFVAADQDLSGDGFADLVLLARYGRSESGSLGLAYLIESGTIDVEGTLYLSDELLIKQRIEPPRGAFIEDLGLSLNANNELMVNAITRNVRNPAERTLHQIKAEDWTSWLELGDHTEAQSIDQPESYGPMRLARTKPQQNIWLIYPFADESVPDQGRAEPLATAE